MSGGESSPTLSLLLADPTDLRPSLAEGLPEVLAGNTRPSKVPRGVNALSLAGPGDNPNDLALQRWGVIAAPGPTGDAALEAIKPLVHLRESEQGAKVKVYRDVPLRASVEEAFGWKNDIWLAEEQSVRPRYLLLLGDANELSFDLQYVLANGAFVGRVHAATNEGYAAYAEKVVRWARSPSDAAKPDALFFVAEDGTDATSKGAVQLLEPCLELARTAPRFPVRDSFRIPGADTVSEFLRATDTEQPSLLLSVTHGLGRPRAGWTTADQQLGLQGALLFGRDAVPRSERVLTAERTTSGAFLSGGLWFCVGCFGAGTPSKSMFRAWLSLLEAEGEYSQPASRLLEGLPEEERPFVAAMPQAALANPEGPLAVIGHVDLAWTFSFVDLDRPTQSRAARVFECLETMARGSRAGVALDALMDSYRHVDAQLNALYEKAEDARLSHRPNPVDPRRLGRLFMMGSDLRGYILLGDPAVRLPLKTIAAST